MLLSQLCILCFVPGLSDLTVLTPALCSWREEGDTEWGAEQAEMAELSLDYLSAVQLFNKYHAKFYRSHPDWFQVTLLSLHLC